MVFQSEDLLPAMWRQRIPQATRLAESDLDEKAEAETAACATEKIVNTGVYTDMAQQKRVALPSSLTAENGAKALLIGEFFEEIEVWNPDACGCDEEDCEDCEMEPEFYTRKVPVTWDTIKRIYDTVVKHFAGDQVK